MKLNLDPNRDKSAWQPATTRGFDSLVDLLETEFGHEKILSATIRHLNDEDELDVIFSADQYVVHNDFLRRSEQLGYEVVSFGPNKRHLYNLNVVFRKKGETI